MSQRFNYVKYDSESVAKQEAFKSMFEGIENYAASNLQDGRAKSLLLTALEEAYMWTGKAIRDEQVNRNNHDKACGSQLVDGAPEDFRRHRPERG